MLELSQIERIENGFGVFEHDWRFYSGFLGEPFLVGDYLVYFDSHTLYICAFSIRDVWKELSHDGIHNIVHSNDLFCKAKLVDIWGRFESCESIEVVGRAFGVLEQSDYDPDFVDSKIVFSSLSESDLRNSRLAGNSARNKGLTTQVKRYDYLTSEHLSLIEYWMSSHTISKPHRAIACSVQLFIRHSNVFVLDVFLGDRLLGFGVISIVSKNAAVLTQMFLMNKSGGRLGDAVMNSATDFVISKGIDTLYLGYSASPSLREFKTKWGAHVNGPPFRESFFSQDREIQKNISDGSFLWRDRLTL